LELVNALNRDRIWPASERYYLVARNGSLGRKGTADAARGAEYDNSHLGASNFNHFIIDIE
jgi:hypothetical protein